MKNASIHLPGGRSRPSGYSEVASSNGVIAVAGQLPGEDVLSRDGPFEEQFQSALTRFLEAVAAAGGTPGEVLHVRIFVRDLGEYRSARNRLAPVYQQAFGDRFPAAALVEVTRLLDDRARLEIEGLAVQSDRRPGMRETTPDEATSATLRLRLSPADARYGERLVPGAKAVEIFGDLETEIAIRTGGDEGLCVGYDSIEFLAPLYAGDFVEATATVVGIGRTSRRIEAELYKMVSAAPDGIGRMLDPPVLAARASATIVPARRGE